MEHTQTDDAVEQAALWSVAFYPSGKLHSTKPLGLGFLGPRWEVARLRGETRRAQHRLRLPPQRLHPALLKYGCSTGLDMVPQSRSSRPITLHHLTVGLMISALAPLRSLSLHNPIVLRERVMCNESDASFAGCPHTQPTCQRRKQEDSAQHVDQEQEGQQDAHVRLELQR